MDKRITVPVLINVFICSLLLRTATSQTPTSCDTSSQCTLDYSRFDPSEINFGLSPYGETNDPCYGAWSSFSSFECIDPTARISSIGATYWCNPGDIWDFGLYDLDCYEPCYPDASANAIVENSEGEIVTVIQDGDYVLYSCPDGFTSTGTKYVSCTDGSWSTHNVFMCLADCGLPENYIYRNETSGNMPHGTVVTIRCKDGYTPTDVVTRKCDNGTYSDIPECKQITTTPVPTTKVTTTVPTTKVTTTDATTTVTTTDATTTDLV